MYYNMIFATSHKIKIEIIQLCKLVQGVVYHNARKLKMFSVRFTSFFIRQKKTKKLDTSFAQSVFMLNLHAKSTGKFICSF